MGTLLLSQTRVTAADRAAAGACYLDRVMPGWARRVRIRPLRMSCDCQCVLGQLASAIVVRRRVRVHPRKRHFRYDDAIAALALTEADQIALGFVSEPASWRWYYHELTRCWRDEIRTRRKGKKR